MFVVAAVVVVVAAVEVVVGWCEKCHPRHKIYKVVVVVSWYIG